MLSHKSQNNVLSLKIEVRKFHLPSFYLVIVCLRSLVLMLIHNFNYPRERVYPGYPILLLNIEKNKYFMFN